MSEDFNEFNSWDCGGAAAMLAVVPAVFYFVNSDHDLTGTAIMAGIAVGVGLFIFVVAHLTDSHLIGRLLHVIGEVFRHALGEGGDEPFDLRYWV